LGDVAGVEDFPGTLTGPDHFQYRIKLITGIKNHDNLENQLNRGSDIIARAL